MFSLFSKIKRIADDRGLSVRQIESSAGLSNGTIRNWDNVQPSVYNVRAVAEVLKVSIDDLMDVENNSTVKERR